MWVCVTGTGVGRAGGSGMPGAGLLPLVRCFACCSRQAGELPGPSTASPMPASVFRGWPGASPGPASGRNVRQECRLDRETSTLLSVIPHSCLPRVRLIHRGRAGLPVKSPSAVCDSLPLESLSRWTALESQSWSPGPGAPAPAALSPNPWALRHPCDSLGECVLGNTVGDSQVASDRTSHRRRTICCRRAVSPNRQSGTSTGSCGDDG